MAEFPTLANLIAAGIQGYFCASSIEGSPRIVEAARVIASIATEQWVASRTITTAEELDALPAESIVKTEGGSVACRFYDGIHGVVFGDDRPFKWSVLASELPCIVLWHPDWTVPDA